MFNSNQKGQGLVEYALILVLIAIVTITAVSALSGSIDGTFVSISDGLGGEGNSTSAPSSYSSAEEACAGYGSAGMMVFPYSDGTWTNSATKTLPDGTLLGSGVGVSCY